jgi:competence protein ComEA
MRACAARRGAAAALARRAGTMCVVLLSCALWVSPPAPFARAAEPLDGLDVNRATQADLEALQGIGVALAERMLEARRAGPFRDWDDLLARVKGIDKARAAALSAQGLTVSGQPWVRSPQPPPAAMR